MHRDFERDIIPMARHFGMALCPWDVLGGGQLQTKAQRAARQESDPTGRGSYQSDEALRVSDALEKVATEHGNASIQQIALAYVMQKAPHVFPLVGGRKVEHLHDNIEALSIKLTDGQIKYIESIKSFDLGFPLDFIGDDPRETGQSTHMMESLLGAKIDWKKEPKAIGHI
jgi:aryl-alcohol dehydrogenase-like predicted oxidoreductase